MQTDFSLNPWKNHPWNDSGKVELVCVDFLLRFANPNPTEETDLCNGEIHHQEVVWQNILDEGMQEPLMLRVNPYDNEIRLESGNHRVRLAKKYGFKYLPVATFVTKKTIFHAGNGGHVFYLDSQTGFKNKVNCSYDYQISIKNNFDNLNIMKTA